MAEQQEKLKTRRSELEQGFKLWRALIDMMDRHAVDRHSVEACITTLVVAYTTAEGLLEATAFSGPGDEAFPEALDKLEKARDNINTVLRVGRETHRRKVTEAWIREASAEE